MANGKGKTGPKVEYDDEELASMILESQVLNPLYSEGAICGVIGYAREYIANRAKKSDLISRTRKEMQAIRERAWLELGLKGLYATTEFDVHGKPKKSNTINPTMFIWMTRNILGWRDEKKSKEKKANEAPSSLGQLLDQFKAVLALDKEESHGRKP
jgi:hypothetical protein